MRLHRLAAVIFGTGALFAVSFGYADDSAESDTRARALEVLRDSEGSENYRHALDLLNGEPAPVFDAPTMADGTPISYNRHVRPILSNNCFACHGPDEATRPAGLRLDVREDAISPLRSGNVALVPGDAAASEMLTRIHAENPHDRMPPMEAGKELTEAEIDILTRWIEGGAPYEPHWAFMTPQRPALPEIAKEDWARNPIDRFVAAHLDEEGLSPSTEADRRTLIRRVAFDLTGLPPTLEEIRAFEEDTSPDAYERMVDSYLERPAYGEHQARHWLDLARYADTNGYHIDNERYMWRWRDWVIEAYNDNLPFDSFTKWQLAGDLLPDPTLEQLIATGFNRNHMINFEGGAIPEEYQTQYVIDRVDATATTWLGLTMACAQCHDHKYDPISHREYFEVFAFFNTVDEVGLDGRDGNAKPFIQAPLPHQVERKGELEANIERLLTAMREPDPELDAEQAAWEVAEAKTVAERWVTLTPDSFESSGGSTLTLQDDASVLATGDNPDNDAYTIKATTDLRGITALRIEAMPDASMFEGGFGRGSNGNFVLTGIELTATPKGGGEPLTVAFTNAQANYSQPNYDVASAIDGNPASGWGVQHYDAGGHPHGVFIAERPFGVSGGTELTIVLKHESPNRDHSIGRFRIAVTDDSAMRGSTRDEWHINGPYIAETGEAAFETNYGPEEGVDLDETYEDGRLKWVRVRPGYADGEVHGLTGDIAATYLYRTIDAPTDRTATLSLGSNDAIRVWLNGDLVHDNHTKRTAEADQDRVAVELREGRNELLMKVVNYGAEYAFYFQMLDEQIGGVPLPVQVALATLSEERSEAQHDLLRDHYRSQHWDGYEALLAEHTEAAAELEALEAEIPTTMVMAEMENPRETFILDRGLYDQPTEKVEPGVPAALPPLPELDRPANRLDFAEWLVDASNPLTPRVTVNRLWSRYFGRGLVATVEDFGAQGAWPTHPELLDWLAVEFVESGWDLKQLHRLILTSATYRQDSRIPPGMHERDPNNRLLARGPRYRLDAEQIRDNALAVGGLLVPEVGGPSVNPYQPPGIWEEVAYGAGYTAQEFEQGQGDELYRRSMYTFWKRQAPPAGLTLFDAPNRETCSARRERTNTPLQALALMNDPQFVEAARHLASRTIHEVNGGTAADRIAHAFELATARRPSEQEQAILEQVFNEQLSEYRENGESAAELLSVGDSPVEEDMDAHELAALTLVASMILNMDAVVTKS